MIFYTINGPTQCLEIRDDHMILKSRGALSWFTTKPVEMMMPLTEIRQFMVERSYGVMGKIVISNGDKTHFMTFSSSYKMVQMIEKYMQKKIIKNIHNLQKKDNVIAFPEKRKKKSKKSSPSIAA